MAIRRVCRGAVGRNGVVLLLLVLCAQVVRGQSAQEDLESCRVHRVTSLPGSHEFAGDFIEAMASDPDPKASGDVFWGLTTDLSEAIPARERLMYISKSTDGGATWKEVAHVDSRYFDARIGEGLRNGFIAAPGGSYFVITTQK